MTTCGAFGVVRLHELVSFAFANLRPCNAPELGAGVGREIVVGWFGGPGESYPCHPLDDHGVDGSGGDRHSEEKFTYRWVGVDTLSSVDLFFSFVAIVVSIVALVWSIFADRNQRRRDLILDSLGRMISNSKKLTHEHRKDFKALDDSVDRGPLRDDQMREQSDEYRNEVGIEYALLKAFGDDGVAAAAFDLYEAHVAARHAIWHTVTACGDSHDCEQSRRHDWVKVEGWGVGRPSANIYLRFQLLNDALVDEVRRQTKIAAGRGLRARLGR